MIQISTRITITSSSITITTTIATTLISPTITSTAKESKEAAGKTTMTKKN